MAPPDRVDLLLVVDDASAMVAEQAALREVLPGVVRALSTGDLEAGAGSAGEGSPDFVPPASVHVGVVTTDMGSGGFATGATGRCWPCGC